MAQSQDEIRRKARERMADWRKTPDYQRWLDESRALRKDLKTKYRRESGVLPRWMTAKRDAHVKAWEIEQRKSHSESMELARQFFFSIGMKLCNKCGLIHGLSDFHRDRRRRDGLMIVCKPCDHARAIDQRNGSAVNKLKHSVRNLIAMSLKSRGYSKRSRTHEILGCDHEFFVRHIERQFTKGMSWDKLGKEIHIDHIVPLATAKTEDDVIALNHYTNLRPCWAHVNLAKSDKLEFIL